jgi:transcriptional regulator with PAS, ATPase and Fis domain
LGSAPDFFAQLFFVSPDNEIGRRDEMVANASNGLRSSVAVRARDRLVGADPDFLRALELAYRAAGTECPILILGETGTGKELVARAIHEESRRREGPFVALNCGAIPPELINSELFGHVRGAFTGAVNHRSGVFADANGGTLFLDELGELPLPLQPHLLRTLEVQAVRPVGSDEDRSIDVRVIAATNRMDIGQGGASLRTDLFHRLSTFIIELPPLRARPGDIPILLRAFLEDFEPRFGKRRIPPDVLLALETYDWPGNVRELRQAVLRAATLCPEVFDLEALLPRRNAPPSREPAVPNLEDIVRDTLDYAYRHHGSIRRAAKALNIPKSTFADRAKRLGVLTRPQELSDKKPRDAQPTPATAPTSHSASGSTRAGAGKA